MRQSSREYDLRQRLLSELALYHVIINFKLSKCNLFDKTLIVQIIQLQL